MATIIGINDDDWVRSDHDRIRIWLHNNNRIAVLLWRLKVLIAIVHVDTQGNDGCLARVDDFDTCVVGTIDGAVREVGRSLSDVKVKNTIAIRDIHCWNTEDKSRVSIVVSDISVHNHLSAVDRILCDHENGFQIVAWSKIR
jgi:hypothetical protein